TQVAISDHPDALFGLIVTKKQPKPELFVALFYDTLYNKNDRQNRIPKKDFGKGTFISGIS
ncbi:MAG: hypothetical protein ACI4SE_06620, partial [Lachnospiraceae bacterium]